MGNVIASITAAFNHAIHELIVSIFDLLIYLAIIVCALIIGRIIGFALRGLFKCIPRPSITATSSGLRAHFSPVSTKYHALP
ncbi:ORF4a protein [Simian hemorrhagic encephalitis virus]|uniref:ORF4a protein n=1 Tax=Simian hemorrhagic encephalitis virus TaxID=1965068 RepID=A0A0F6PT38_9NIDO|nr:ORF4a protein [Simian hemorrhagic encephalitis virus]AKC89296.1 ORF4a protein [Simian hemorrhagic encephalitis virus]